MNEVIDRLIRFRSPDALVLSVYINVPPVPGEVQGARASLHTLIKPALELVKSGDLDHQARESLRSDVDRVRGLEGRLSSLEGKALGVFSCTKAGLWEEVTLPRRVRDRVVIDVAPYVRPLVAVLAEFPHYCVVVIDRTHTWLYRLHMGRIEEIEKVTDQELRKPDSAGPRVGGIPRP